MSEKKTPDGKNNNAALKQEPAVKTNPRNDDKTEKKPLVQSKYSAAELAANAWKIFSKPPEVVAAALKMAGKATATLDEAKEIVGKFLKREVK